MAASFEALAGFVVRFRLAIVAAWGVVLVAAILALPGLGSQANSDPSLFLSSGARSVEAASLGTPLLGSQDTSKITIVAARASGPLTPRDLAAVGREAGLTLLPALLALCAGLVFPALRPGRPGREGGARGPPVTASGPGWPPARCAAPGSPSAPGR
jgi:hypothetical protein